MRGLNTAQPIDRTEPGYGLVLENWVGRTDGLHVRAGHTVVQSGLGASVTALVTRGGSVLGATADKLWSGGSAVQTVTSGDWHSAQLPNAGGLWTVAANGTSGGLLAWNGTDWIKPTIDGMDQSKIVGLVVAHNRLFLVERDTLTLWYLDSFAFGGTAKPVFLQQLCRNGGSVATVGVLTQDGGRNSNDTLIAITTEGEAVTWVGSDPANSVSWAQGGVFTLPKPVGRRCLVTHDGGLAYLSTLGLLKLPDAMQRSDQEKKVAGLSDDIWPTLTPLLGSGSWSLASSIDHELLIVSGPSGQFVRSSTGAWCTFAGLNATSWASAGGDLYFGTSDGKVCRYGGGTDNGSAISSYLVDRFDRYGTARRKKITRIRPQFTMAHPYRPRIQMVSNYRTPEATFPAHWTEDTSWQWEDLSWPRTPALWERSISSRIGRWRGVRGDGIALALAMGMKTKTAVIYTGHDVIMEAGGSV